MNKRPLKLFFIFFSFFFSLPVLTAGSGNVVINEIAWMGTEKSSADEWIELYNNSNQNINLDGWGLYEQEGKILIESLTETIKAESYYLIERTDDTSVPDIEANQTPSSWAGHGLNNNGEHLQLLDNNLNIIDEVNCREGWFIGQGKPEYRTMERINPLVSGNDSQNWKNSQNPGGTPKAKNSVITDGETIKVKPEQIESQITKEKSILIIYPSGIIFSEILPSPEGPDAENEWIEIFNQNNFEVDLFNWQITDIKGKTNIYTFPQGIKISSWGFLVLSRPTTKIILNNSGDGLNLIQPDEKIVDTIIYEKAPQNQSYNRLEGDFKVLPEAGSYNRTDFQWLWNTTLTPGSENIVPSSILETEGITSPSPEETSKTQTKKKEIAAIGEQLPKESNTFFILLIALAVAIFSGIIILILKKGLKNLIFRRF